MCNTFTTDNCKISLAKKGSKLYSKMSFPVHCGLFHEIETREFIFQFNLNHEILRAKGKGEDWAHPHEWLKRTQGNDWVYYSTGGYTGVFEATGEYYLPNLQYPTNSILGGHPFQHQEIDDLTRSWHLKLRDLQHEISLFPEAFQTFYQKVLDNSPKRLEDKSQRLLTTIGGRISVLPPDARHVDYNFIPLTISRGCLYKCKFCKVKNGSIFSELSREAITEQIRQLKELYANDISNYNSLFLGEHDAFQTSPDLLLYAIQEAIDALHLKESYVSSTNIFLFGSVSSLLNAPDILFEQLNTLHVNTFINIGLESADQETLDKIGKPITEKLVQKAFARSQNINDKYPSIEITANFIMDEKLPEGHYPKILQLIRDQQKYTKAKGSIYFSPLTFDQPSRSRLFEFNRIKILSRLPTYLYIIQRF